MSVEVPPISAMTASSFLTPPSSIAPRMLAAGPEKTVSSGNRAHHCPQTSELSLRRNITGQRRPWEAAQNSTPPIRRSVTSISDEFRKAVTVRFTEFSFERAISCPQVTPAHPAAFMMPAASIS